MTRPLPTWLLSLDVLEADRILALDFDLPVDDACAAQFVDVPAGHAAVVGGLQAGVDEFHVRVGRHEPVVLDEKGRVFDRHALGQVGICASRSAPWSQTETMNWSFRSRAACRSRLTLLSYCARWSPSSLLPAAEFAVGDKHTRVAGGGRILHDLHAAIHVSVDAGNCRREDEFRGGDASRIAGEPGIRGPSAGRQEEQGGNQGKTFHETVPWRCWVVQWAVGRCCHFSPGKRATQLGGSFTARTMQKTLASESMAWYPENLTIRVVRPHPACPGR